MITRFIIILFLLSPLSAHADKAADKDEFKQLYAQFNDLYQNSEDIDPIIKAGEKLYKLAAKIYKKNSQNMAVVTFNLASLYDEKGGETASEEEKKSFDLYRKYFNILGKLKTPKDRSYLQHYQQYMITYYNINPRKSNYKISDEVLNLASKLDLSDIELAHIKFTVAVTHVIHKKFKKAGELLTSALDIYTREYGEENENVLHSQYWLAMVDLEKGQFKKAISRYDKVVEFYSDDRPDPKGMLKNSHLILHNIYFSRQNGALSDFHYNKYHQLTGNGEQSVGSWQAPNDDDEDYLPIIRVNPTYPSRAAQNGIEGYVVVDFTVTPKGETKDVKVTLSSHKMFERSAVKAATNYKYRPRIINEEAVEVKNVRVRIEYRLGH